MTGATSPTLSRDNSILGEKDPSKTIRIEDVADNPTQQDFEPAEMEPRMNWQTCVAFLVCQILLRFVLVGQLSTGFYANCLICLAGYL